MYPKLSYIPSGIEFMLRISFNNLGRFYLNIIKLRVKITFYVLNSKIIFHFCQKENRKDEN